jgi:GTP cyclohydrolase I
LAKRLTEQEIEALREEEKHDLKRMQERLRPRKGNKDK